MRITKYVAMTAWQDIETAPKDGTRVLLYDCYCREPEHARFVGFWAQDARDNTWKWWSCPGAFIKRPTHWQPLPDPPR